MHVIRRRAGKSLSTSPPPSTSSSTAAPSWPRPGHAALMALSPEAALAQRISDLPDPTKDLYPVKRNEKYALDRPVTDEKINTNYNNFYEFGSSKSVAQAAQALKLRPWTIKLDGMVEKAQEIGIDDLIRKMPLEERLYRHRCVEAWSMAIPWSRLSVCQAGRAGQAAVVGEICADGDLPRPDDRARQRQSWYPWPYVEGLTMAEATNELAFLVTGAYGKPVSKVQGAPLRLAVPWKYGFKSIKSIVRFTFTDQRPKSYWEALQAPSTASGPTSTRRCRIRAGARRPRS